MRGRRVFLGLSLFGVLCLVADGRSRAPAPQLGAPFRDAIAAREYHASHSPSGVQAPNRAHCLRTFFSPDGIRVHDRTADNALLELTLVGLGRGSALAPVPAGDVVTDGPNVEIRRPELVEWYR